MAFAFLFGSILCAVCGQMLMKVTVMKLHGLDFASGAFFQHITKLLTSPYFFAAMTVYFSSMIFYLMAISRLDLSMAYPMVSINYAIVLFVSKLFFGEKVSALRWFGVAVIIGGVFLVSQSG